MSNKSRCMKLKINFIADIISYVFEEMISYTFQLNTYIFTKLGHGS